jgi:hypothetical protein
VAQLRIMGDHDHRTAFFVDVLQQPHDLQPGGVTEIAGRLIRQDQQRPVEQARAMQTR